jgi:hypothetical protein
MVDIKKSSEETEHVIDSDLEKPRELISGKN